MSELADIRDILIEQNAVLGLTADSTKNTEKEIKKVSQYFTGLDALEKRRDQQAAASGVKPTEKVMGTKSGTGFKMPDIGLGGLFTTAGLASFATRFGKRLLGGGLAVIFADEIATAITDYFGDDTFKDEIERGLTYGGLGFLFGKKLGIAGLAYGVLIDKETEEKLGPIITDIKEALFGKNGEGGLLPSLETIREFLVDGLEGVRDILTGDFKKAYDDGNLTEAFTLMGAFAALFAPGLALRVAIGAATLPFKAGGKVLRSLGLLAGLGNTIGDMPIPGQTGPTIMKDSKGKEYVRGVGVDGKPTTSYSAKDIADTKAGRTPGKFARAGRVAGAIGRGAARFLGPLGIALTVVELGMLATDIFKTTEMYADLKKKSDKLGEIIDEGVEGQSSMSLDETSISDASLSGIKPIDRVRADAIEQANSYYMHSQGIGAGREAMEKYGRRSTGNVIAPIDNSQMNQVTNNSSSPIVLPSGGATDYDDSIMRRTRMLPTS